MPRGIEIDPKRGSAGLEVGLSCSESQNRRLAVIEIRHIEVEVGLLRMLVAGPLGWHMTRHPLKRDRGTGRAPQPYPVDVGVGIIHFPSEDRPVEAGHTFGIGGVEGDE